MSPSRRRVRRLRVMPALAVLVGIGLLWTCTGDRSVGPGAPPARGIVAATSGTSAQVLVGAGDIARCDRTFDEATASILDTIPGQVFTVGDNVLGSSSAPPDFIDCYNPSWGRHKARTRPAVGHMEGWSPGYATYVQYFGAAAGDSAKFYYSYDLANWHVVVLNSNLSMAVGSTQEQWLKADLAAHPAYCTVAIWHLPRFSSTSSSGLPVVNASVKPLWDDLYAAGATIVLNAHYEVYERFAPQRSDGTADPQLGILQRWYPGEQRGAQQRHPGRAETHPRLDRLQLAVHLHRRLQLQRLRKRLLPRADPTAPVAERERRPRSHDASR